MSHFTVLVIGDEIDEQLARYEEDTSNLRKEWLEFSSTEEEGLQEYENEKCEVVVLADGTWKFKHDRSFEEEISVFDRKYVYPSGSQLVEKPYNELYPTFEIYMEEYHGNPEKDPIENKYGYWHNPMAKWDWYSVGGRWSGFFKMKDGCSAFVGQPGAFGNKAKENHGDSCLLNEIDILGMKEDARKEANETYDKLESVLKGRELPSWEKTLKKNGDSVDAAREEYNSNLVHKELIQAGMSVFGGYYETFGPNREEYVNRCVNSVMVPYAVVKDGKWYERGEMGWFGFSSNEKDPDEWNREFWKLIDDLPQDTLLTIVDCHI